MKAAVVHDFTKSLSLEDVPKPRPGPGEVLVKVETAGLCHTDIHAAHGDWPVKPTPPFIPGHEGVGIVEEVGPGVSTPQVGDRVAMPWLGEACGVCDYCVDGWETLCEKQVNTGYGVDGSYAEYAVAKAAYVAQVPDAVDPLDAAVLTCAGVTTYKAVKLSGARPGSAGRGVRHRRPRPPRPPVRQDQRRNRGRRRHQRREAGARQGARRRPRRQRADRGPGRGHQGARRSARGDLRGRRAEGLRAGVQRPAPRRHARLRRAAGGQLRQAADLRDGAERHHDPRVHRGHPQGPGRGLRDPRPGPHPGDPRDPASSTRSTSASKRSRRVTSRPVSSSTSADAASSNQARRGGRCGREPTPPPRRRSRATATGRQSRSRGS